MVRKILIGAICLLTISNSFGQLKKEDVTPKNSWLKAGISAGIPVGDIGDSSSFVAGVELSGQFMKTRHWGIGIASGFSYFFAKNNSEGFGNIPLGLMLRYYHKPKGIFAGVDGGYNFIFSVVNTPGGLYVRPELGYHDYNWNIFGFYKQVFVPDAFPDVQSIGVAATYNIRFNKRQK